MGPGNKTLWRIVGLLFLLSLGLFLYLIASSWGIRSSTGALKLSSPDKNAVFSLSGLKTQAVFAGKGKVNLRLKPGVYLVTASDNDKTAYSQALVKNGGSTSLVIDPAKALVLPSVEGINFSNLSVLLNNGLSTEQVNSFRSSVFEFKPGAKVVVLKPGSFEPAPHNPNVDTNFSANLGLAIDGATYKATITYSSLEAVRLYLYDSSGQQVFDSGSH